MSMSLRSYNLIVLAVMLFLPAMALADEYTVTPRVIDVEAEARDIITETIYITNTGHSRTRIFPSVNEIALDAGGDITEFRGPTQVDRTSAITSWIEVSRAQIAIMPGEVHELPVTIRMNPNTQPGEYHALIGFGYGRNNDEAKRQVAEGRAPTVVVTVRVAENRIERVDLSNFVIEKFITSADNEAVTYTLKNPGNTAVVPTGEVVIYDSNGKEITSIDANPDKTELGPGESITLTSTVPIGGLVGQYKGFLNVSYGAAQTGALYDTVFFYVLPWQRLLFIFGTIVIVAITLTVYLYRRYGIDDDDAKPVAFHIKDHVSDAKDHDIDLKSSK